jgi:glucose/mannose-6-phosphate isomerase
LFDRKKLDDIELINRIDRSKMLRFSLRMDRMITEAVRLTDEVRLRKDYSYIKNIVVLGMGGSSIGGELLKDWLKNRIDIPIEICNTYKIPIYLNKNSLVFTISYSGNTEETLIAFTKALKRKCKTFT